MKIEIIVDPQEKSLTCERILRALPEWFGIETALVQYVVDVRSRLTWVASVDGEAVGFLSVTRHFPETAEIHVLGALREWHGRKVGSALVETAAAALRADGVQFLTVKTLSPAREDANYARTRAFYLRMGFVPIEEFKTLWGEANPCLLLVRTLRA